MITNYVFHVLAGFFVAQVLPICFFKFIKPNKVIGFQKVKDLIRGTITTNINEMHEAYLYFKETPGVKVFAIKEKLDKLQNITVNFIFMDKIIGEM